MGKLKTISCDGLGRVERLLLVMLAEPGLAVLPRWHFRRVAKQMQIQTHWSKNDRTAISSLSRALRGLEDQGYIRRAGGRFELTEQPPGSSGVELALLAWARDREHYAARYGLKGPPPEALGIKPKKEERAAVQVELHCD